MEIKALLFDKVFGNINISHAKCVAFLLVLIVTGYYFGNYIPEKTTIEDQTCESLLNDGHYVGKQYQPLDCTMHYYTTREARQCLTNRYHQLNESLVIYFYGASKIRGLYYGLVRLLNGTAEPMKIHNNIFFADPRIHLDMHFYWSMLPTGNRAPLYQKLVDILERKNNHSETGQTKNNHSETGQTKNNHSETGQAKNNHNETGQTKYNHSETEQIPDLMINGGGTHMPAKIHHLFIKYLESFLPLLTKIQRRSKILFVLHEDLEEHKLKNPNEYFTTKTFRGFNDAMETVFNNSKVQIWRSVRSVASGSGNPTADGLHLHRKLVDINAQVIFNWYCNKYMEFEKGTCCRTRLTEVNVAFNKEEITTAQIVIAIITVSSCAIMIVILVWKYMHRFLRKHDIKSNEYAVLSIQDKEMATDKNATNYDQELGAVDFLTCMARLGIIMAYFFLCDRTNLFKTEEKHYSHLSFFLPLAFTAIAGIVFHSKSKYTTVLHRDQTDEWKGWMQLVILIYHYTGASKVLPIYMHIRVLVSSYLVLSGFGHFYHYFTKADFSFRRLCTVLFRSNFLVILLCLTMNRPYQFYYFVPLVSFWFVVCHALMSIWPIVPRHESEARPRQCKYILLKVALLFGVITGLYASEALFQYVFANPILRYFFTMDNNSLHEWRFRWSIDRYSTVYGMLLGVVILISKEKSYFNDSTSENLFPSGKVATIAIVSMLGFVGYGMFSCYCEEKTKCNEIHTLITLFPILSFVVLCNTFGWIRTRFSYFFCWFGRISLELFISQYHIWLASDTHQVLVLVNNQPALNLCITSFIFVCIAHEIHTVTAKLVPYVIPKDWKLIFRNFVIVSILLCVFLIPKNEQRPAAPRFLPTT